jgi:hypothetical protein
MRRAGWAAIGILSSALAWAGAAQERRDDPAAPATDAPGPSCADRDSCVELVIGYEYGQGPSREDARRAIDRVRELCADGQGVACRDLAIWATTGRGDIVTADLDAARGFARRACDLGLDCEVLEELSYPPPTPAEEDDIHEAIFRRLIPKDRSRGVLGRSPFYCLAFGTDADPTGQDPPPSFMVRLAEIEDVRPRSWCIANHTGNRISVGPLAATPPRLFNGRVVRTWTAHQSFGGGAGSQWIEVQQKNGAWVLRDHVLTSQEPRRPALPTPDLTEDRQRIAAAAAAFAAAWNLQDFDEMARMRGLQGDRLRAWSMGLQARMAAPMADTRLDPEVNPIEFENPLSAKSHMRLLGTWTPSPGSIVPLKPWKHAGSVTKLSVRLRKDTWAWEPGDWRVDSFDLPWDGARPY